MMRVLHPEFAGLCARAFAWEDTDPRFVGKIMSKAQIISPLPGTFYRKASPESPPFKQDGDPVSALDVIGLIEVMKNFQEVTADAEGRAITFLVEDGEAIMAGQAIAEIDT